MGILKEILIYSSFDVLLSELTIIKTFLNGEN